MSTSRITNAIHSLTTAMRPASRITPYAVPSLDFTYERPVYRGNPAGRLDVPSQESGQIS
jgi:hypothetical protein